MTQVRFYLLLTFSFSLFVFLVPLCFFVIFCVLFFFFFKQKTAYEMRISDWSSDVCSSDLVVGLFYGYFGDLMPEGLFYHGGIRLSRLIGYTSIPYFSGLLGGLAELSAGTIFPFMVFAAALQVTGCVDFIMKIAYRIGGNTRAGPAQIAIRSEENTSEL